MSDIRYEFIMSQIKHIRDIKENEKTKISLVYYEGCQGPCVFKICKNRNLSQVYHALMEVQHPNLAIVYDCVYENGNTYVVEEYISGKTLAEILGEKGIFTEEETARITIGLCEGLEVLHRHEPSIIHNDIKTSNIMIREDGIVKLVDYDISRTYKEGSYKNTKLMGTHEYAAPEHYGFGQSEPRTDIYSLGVTMHEMLTGVGLNPEHNITYQGGLEKIIRKCVEIDRKKRYATAALLKTDLEKAHLQKGRRFQIALMCSICLILLFVVGVIFLSDYLGRGDKPQNTMGTEGYRTENDSEKNQNDETEGNNSQEDESVGTEENTPQEDENTGTEGNNSEGDSSEDKDGGMEDNADSSGTENSGQINDNAENNNSTGNEINGEGNNNGISDSKTPMEQIYRVEGTLLAMEAWTDGTFLLLEEISGNYYLRSSDGMEKLLEGAGAAKGADLGCDPYTNTMYLSMSHYDGSFIYSVNKELELELLTELNFTEGMYVELGTFSDGRLTYGNYLINCKDGAVIGNVSPGTFDSHYLIKDKFYSVKFKDKLNSVFQAFIRYDENSNFEKEVKVNQYISFLSSPSDDALYSNSKELYFIGERNGKEYLYRFDGENCEVIVCLNDYDGYTYFHYGYLCVTDTVFRCYNYNRGIIVEFPLE